MVHTFIYLFIFLHIIQWYTQSDLSDNLTKLVKTETRPRPPPCLTLSYFILSFPKAKAFQISRLRQLHTIFCLFSFILGLAYFYLKTVCKIMIMLRELGICANAKIFLFSLLFLATAVCQCSVQ